MRLSHLIIFSLIFISFGIVISSSPPEPIITKTVTQIATPTPEPSPIAIPINISAQAIAIINPDTGQLLAAKNPHQRFMPASTTKMMTAYIALKYFDLDEVITITRSEDAIGKSTKFTLGEQYLVSDILKAALINSGNDAALSLADHYPGGYNQFVVLMNQQVQAWGLKDTHFSNVSGVEANNHFSSAYDLAIIATHFMSKSILAQMVNQPSGSITSIDKKYSHNFTNTNELLGEIPGLIGIKTGWTDNAGECLISYVDRDTDYIIVVLNSQDRFGDTKKLIDWTYSALGSLIP